MLRGLTKRFLDLIVALLTLIALAPLMGALALAIKHFSPGPVFFRQRRIGRGGRSFWLYKFRTMQPRPPSGPCPEGPAITTAGDPRITPIGRRLRDWKLDELPQLLNVLRGEMSLVGPRPEVPQYVSLEDPRQREVLSVRPGVTGLTQIRFRDEEQLLAAQPDPEAYYVTTLLPAKLALDLEYVHGQSLRRDLEILARTLFAIGRYGTARREAAHSTPRRRRSAMTLWTRRSKAARLK
jgi:lipopolysaccharide/colanic/teichoic acid biosynthesis glycosyltransferase